MTRRPLPARRRNNAPVRPRRRPSTIVPDILLGILAGAIEAVLFHIPLGALLWAPFLLLFFAPQAVRRHLPGPLRAARTSD
jgi:hypothetical protein